MLISEPIEERRRILETRCKLDPFVAPQWRSETTAGLEAAFEAARDRGNEGLRDQASRQSLRIGKTQRRLDEDQAASWRARCRHHRCRTGQRPPRNLPFGLHLRRSRWRSVFECRKGVLGAHRPGSARTHPYSAKPRDRKFGKVAIVKPEVVLEVAFDGVQKSPRHKSGYSFVSPNRSLGGRQAGQRDRHADRVKELYEAIPGAVTLARESRSAIRN